MILPVARIPEGTSEPVSSKRQTLLPLTVSASISAENLKTMYLFTGTFDIRLPLLASTCKNFGFFSASPHPKKINTGSKIIIKYCTLHRPFLNKVLIFLFDYNKKPGEFL